MNSCFSSGFWGGTWNNEALRGKTIIWRFHDFPVSSSIAVDIREVFLYISMLVRNWIISVFLFSLREFSLPSTLCELKGPSEMCDVWRGDSLAGIQLIVHQSGRAAMTALSRTTADRWQLPARHSRPQKQHLPTVSDALGMEIRGFVGCTAHLLCFERMNLPVLVSMHAELELKCLQF